MRRERFSHRQPEIASVTSLLSFIIVTNSDAALAAKAICPESLKRWRGTGHTIVSEEEPETEHWLGKDIEDRICDDLSIKSNKSAAISDTPNTVKLLARTRRQLGTETHIG